MKIAIFEVEPHEQEVFSCLNEHHQVTFIPVPLNAQNAEEHADAEIISTFIYSRLSSQTFQKLPNLKMIATRSTGYDHIDAHWCREHGIVVSNVPEYGAHTVAEHVFALLLTISHHMYEAIIRTRRGEFTLKGLQGFDLLGKTMGIVGTGDIGLHAIRIARGFGMEVLAYDIHPQEHLAGEMGFRYVSFEELLRNSDVISLHVPANPHTTDMLSTAQFEKMKDGAVLINTSRGSVVDTQALLQALATGKVAAAGLDVLQEEPVIREEAELLRSVFQKTHNLEDLLADHILLRLRNVFITPHSAFNTKEAVGRILDTTLENIQSFIAGETRNVVIG